MMELIRIRNRQRERERTRNRKAILIFLFVSFELISKREFAVAEVSQQHKQK